LDELNNPIIRLEVATNSDDLRDKVAKRFTEALGHTSHHCSIKFLPEQSSTHVSADGSSHKQVWEISPVSPRKINNNVFQNEIRDEVTNDIFKFENMSEQKLGDFLIWVKENPGPYKIGVERVK